MDMKVVEKIAFYVVGVRVALSVAPPQTKNLVGSGNEKRQNYRKVNPDYSALAKEKTKVTPRCPCNINGTFLVSLFWA